MATELISGLNGGVALTSPASGDLLVIVDVSDTAEAPTGTTKKITAANLLGAGAAPTGSAGGDLAGTYPNPTLNPDAAALSPAFETLTDGATITWAFSGDRIRNAKVTLGGNRTLDITGEVDGCTGTLIVIQDGTGSRTLTLPGSSKVINDGSGAVTLSTVGGSIDILTFIYDGSNFYWTIGQDYS